MYKYVPPSLDFPSPSEDDFGKDVAIWPEGSDSPVLVHGFILKGASQVLGAMLDGLTSENFSKDDDGMLRKKPRHDIRVTDSEAAVKLLVQMLYTGPYGETPSCSLLLATLELAARWQMDDVVEYIASGVKAGHEGYLTDATFDEIAAVAFRVDVPVLRRVHFRLLYLTKKTEPCFAAELDTEGREIVLYASADPMVRTSPASSLFR